jgi:hypothetical protein
MRAPSAVPAPPAVRVAVRRPVRHLTFAFALLASAGCFHYEPLSSGQAPQGSMLRLHLSDAGSARLATTLGPGTAVVEGRTIALSDTAYVLAVSSVERGGATVPWAGEAVVVSREAVARVEHRTLDRRRTIAVAGVVLAAAVVSGRLAANAGGSMPGPGDGGTPAP